MKPNIPIFVQFRSVCFRPKTLPPFFVVHILMECFQLNKSVNGVFHIQSVKLNQYNHFQEFFLLLSFFLSDCEHLFVRNFHRIIALKGLHSLCFLNMVAFLKACLESFQNLFWMHNSQKECFSGTHVYVWTLCFLAFIWMAQTST